MLPFEPQSIAELKARLPDAVCEICDAEQSAALPSDQRPGHQRRHVFDFPNGLRLVFTAEFYRSTSCAMLHVSASAAPGTKASRWGNPLEFASRAAAQIAHFTDIGLEELAGWHFGGQGFHWLLRRENISLCLMGKEFFKLSRWERKLAEFDKT